MRRFAGVQLGDDVIPGEEMILRFRHLLAKHRLTEVIFAEVNGPLAVKRLLSKSGTILDATVSAAPSRTKRSPKAAIRMDSPCRPLGSPTDRPIAGPFPSEGASFVTQLPDRHLQPVCAELPWLVGLHRLHRLRRAAGARGEGV